MQIIAKYDLGAVLLQMMTDPTGAIETLHNLATETAAKIDAIDAAAKGTKTEKVNPLETKYGKDDKGAKAALDFLRSDGGVFDLVTAYIGEDDDSVTDSDARTFHLKNAISEYLVKFLAIEVAFYSAEIAPKTHKVSDKAALKVDFGEMRDLIAHIAGIKSVTPGPLSVVDDKGNGEWRSPLIDLDSQGKVKSIIAGKRGPRKAKTDGVTGRYAKVYNLAWSIDGEDVESGWTIPLLNRYLYSGADRIGKTAKTLTDILDAKTPWMTSMDPFSTALTINGHKVIVSRIGPDTDEVDDDDDDDDSDEESETE